MSEAQEVVRDNKGRWMKGHTGNPAGRTRIVPHKTIALFTDNAPQAVRRLFKLMDSKDEAVRLQAVKYFLDKALGKDWQACIPDEAQPEGLTIRITRATEESREPYPVATENKYYDDDEEDEENE